MLGSVLSGFLKLRPSGSQLALGDGTDKRRHSGVIWRGTLRSRSGQRVDGRPCAPAADVGNIATVGINKTHIVSRWELRPEAFSVKPSYLREAVLASLETAAFLYRDRSPSVRRARTLDGILAPSAWVCHPGRRTAGRERTGAYLEARFSGEPFDNPDLVLDVLARYSTAGSYILWNHDGIADDVVLSLTDGRRCAHLGVPVDHSKAVLTADAAITTVATTGGSRLWHDVWAKRSLARSTRCCGLC